MRILSVIAVLVLPLVLSAFTAGRTCTGRGAGSGATSVLTCTGSCTNGHNCPDKREVLFQGKVDMKFCGCDANQPACCFLALDYHHVTGAVISLDALGDCPSCPTSGACQKATIDGLIQAACLPAPVPPLD